MSFPYVWKGDTSLCRSSDDLSGVPEVLVLKHLNPNYQNFPLQSGSTLRLK